jgi:hypothetical protein
MHLFLPTWGTFSSKRAEKRKRMNGSTERYDKMSTAQWHGPTWGSWNTCGKSRKEGPKATAGHVSHVSPWKRRRVSGVWRRSTIGERSRRTRGKAAVRGMPGPRGSVPAVLSPVELGGTCCAIPVPGPRGSVPAVLSPVELGGTCCAIPVPGPRGSAPAVLSPTHASGSSCRPKANRASWS